ncbi:MAG TPA: hypothetical protein VGS57_08965 [Thermoanaerobaculia bacterium]|jgi:hypothetical protein|nr:hypothetical protein [Thermoanaerobaculia bacterium]
MSVQELSTLHKRYVDVSDRFKSSWTYHQFLQGLHKLAGEGELGQYATEFQAVYGLLKEVSQHLTAVSTDRVRNELEMVERQLQDLNRWLLQEDGKVVPSQLRMFFQRVRNYNEGILVQLVKFYLYMRPAADWGQELHDKLDFLITKLSEEAQGPQGPWVLQERSKVRAIYNGLWQLVGGLTLTESEVEQHRGKIDELRRRMLRAETFDQLIDGELIAEYRRFKFGLGRLFLHPELLIAIVETNLALRNHIQQLYRREEQRIVADYQRIFELERVVAVDTQLDLELSAFREEVETFEKNLQNESLSLGELRRLRQHVRTLIPRLTGIQASEELFSEPSAPQGSGGQEPQRSPTAAGAAAAASTNGAPSPGVGWGEDLLVDHHRKLLRALDGVQSEVSPKVAAFSPELFPFRLEPREVVAFRRLNRHEDATNRDLESFLLWAASLRSRTQDEIEEIRGILDDTMVTREATVFGRAKQTARLADLFVHRFDHEIAQTVLAGGGGEEARELQVLKMRLVRESAGLWLLIYKP